MLGAIRLPSTRRSWACAALVDLGDDTYEMCTHGAAAGASYIVASYVKFIEGGGARVIPLVYNEPEERLLEKLRLVNGVLFTGGSQKNGSYFETIKRVFQDNNILESFDALNQPSTLQFHNYSFLEGSVFQRFDLELIKKLNTSCLVMQNHIVVIPVVPTVRVVITFTKFAPLIEPEEFFTPMSSPSLLASLGPGSIMAKLDTHKSSYLKWSSKNSRSKSMNLSQVADNADPFTIPSDYTWVNNTGSKIHDKKSSKYKKGKGKET